MMWPVQQAIVRQQPVATLAYKRHANRDARRRTRYGKIDRFAKLNGLMSPKQMRESGL